MALVLFVLTVFLVFLVKDACVLVLYLIDYLSCGVKLSLPVISAGVII